MATAAYVTDSHSHAGSMFASARAQWSQGGVEASESAARGGVDRNSGSHKAAIQRRLSIGDAQDQSWESVATLHTLDSTVSTAIESVAGGYVTPSPTQLSPTGEPVILVGRSRSAGGASSSGDSPVDASALVARVDPEFLAAWRQAGGEEGVDGASPRSRGRVVDVVEGCLGLITDAMRRGIAPKLTDQVSTGGSYFMEGVYRHSIGVFKPEDEEPFAVNNPKKHRGSVQPGAAGEGGVPGIKHGVNVGEGAAREVAAFLLDHDGFARVPPSVFVYAAHPRFHVADDQSAGGDPPLKHGSLQLYVPHYCSAEDVSSSLFPVDEVHHIGVHDLRLFNTDRNLDNILVCPSFPEDNPASHGHADDGAAAGPDADGMHSAGKFSVVAHWEEYVKDAAFANPAEDDEREGRMRLRRNSGVGCGGGAATAAGSDTTGAAPCRPKARRQASSRHKRRQVRSQAQGEVPLALVMKARSVSYEATVDEDGAGATSSGGDNAQNGEGLLGSSPESSFSAGLPDRRPLLCLSSAHAMKKRRAQEASSQRQQQQACAPVCAGAGAAAASSDVTASPPGVAAAVSAAEAFGVAGAKSVSTGSRSGSSSPTSDSSADGGHFARGVSLLAGMGSMGSMGSTASGTTVSQMSPCLPPALPKIASGKLPTSPLDLRAPSNALSAAVAAAAALRDNDTRAVRHLKLPAHPPAAPTGLSPVAPPSPSAFVRASPAPGNSPLPPQRTRAKSDASLRPTRLPTPKGVACGADDSEGRVTPPVSAGFGALLNASQSFTTPVRIPSPPQPAAASQRSRSMSNARASRRVPRMSPLLSRTARASDSAAFDPRELRRATSVSLVPIDHGLCLPHITCLDEAEFGWLYWRQAKQPFSAETLRFIEELDGEADADRLRAVMGPRMREGCLATLRVCTELLKRGAAAGLTLFGIARIMVRERPDTPSVLEQVVAAARRATAAAMRAAGESVAPAEFPPRGADERAWYDAMMKQVPQYLDMAVEEAVERAAAQPSGRSAYNRLRSTTL